MNDMAHPVSEALLRDKVAALPALPPLVVDLLASFHDDTLDVATLARRIAADHGLLMRTLRVANSPFYGLAGQVLSIDDAILVLGFRTVRSLVLGAALVEAFKHCACKGFLPEVFWCHSVAVAVSARELARLLGRNAESAFTGGLLHDIGRYVLALCFPAAYQHALDYQQAHGCPHQVAEQAVLGVDHMLAGAVLARTWRLPEALVDDIRCHHAPAQNPAADLLHLADILAHALELGRERGGMVPPMDPGVCQRLGLDAAKLYPLLGHIEGEYREACNALLS